MQDPELAVVYSAIEVFYSGQNNSQAATWLDDFQKSILAWTACDRILGERKNPVASYFAAQTLRQKILKNLKEVPRESLESLRDSIINHLTHLHVVDQSSEATATQLCLAVVDLYIQVPEWIGFIATMLNKFNGLEGDRTKMLLTLLKVFPEEVEHSSIGENRRKAVREELAINGDSILAYLASVLSSALSKEHHDEDIVKKVVQCLSTFLQNPNVHTDRLAQSDLFAVVFSILASPFVSVNLHDAATECVVSGLVRVEDIHAHRALAVVLHQASFKLQTAWNEAVSKEQLDRLSNFTRIFVELCESLIEPVVNQNKEAAPLHELNIFELLLLIANHFDYSLIEMTFNVWYRISEALFMIDDDDHIALFKPFVRRYLVALVRHSRYDSDEVGLPDQHSDFGDFRFKVEWVLSVFIVNIFFGFEKL
ncbi:unnamed protein product, partial [Mesorhabditis belari]|uniref:Importin N-terminal domain-containing protein n=1 Tax=Mesorhabditis belari TaxID=2138241 RepID=A0AAF3ETS6_9BILA